MREKKGRGAGIKENKQSREELQLGNKERK